MIIIIIIIIHKISEVCYVWFPRNGPDKHVLQTDARTKKAIDICPLSKEEGA